MTGLYWVKIPEEAYLSYYCLLRLFSACGGSYMESGSRYAPARAPSWSQTRCSSSAEVNCSRTGENKVYKNHCTWTGVHAEYDVKNIGQLFLLTFHVSFFFWLCWVNGKRQPFNLNLLDFFFLFKEYFGLSSGIIKHSFMLFVQTYQS